MPAAMVNPMPRMRAPGRHGGTALVHPKVRKCVHLRHHQAMGSDLRSMHETMLPARPVVLGGTSMGSAASLYAALEAAPEYTKRCLFADRLT